MALIKDDKIYRTIEEQVAHLTKAHRDQLAMNNNFSNQIAEISENMNLGGYNFVRFSFSKKGTFYRFPSNTEISVSGADEGDYFEITSNNTQEIPAYGYYFNGNINISFRGDFTENYTSLNVKNVTKNFSSEVNVVLETFDGTGLIDYNPNDRKKQHFNVLTDLTYGTTTQYCSFDLNGDDVYNWVYLGAATKGLDGKDTLVAKNIFNNTEKPSGSYTYTWNTVNFNREPESGETFLLVYKYNAEEQLSNADSSYIALCFVSSVLNNTVSFNISSYVETKGIQGVQGLKGNTGEKGERGEQGEQGEKGERGDVGGSILLQSTVLSNPSELPDISTVQNYTAYIVTNTFEGEITYDLYYKGENATEWSVLSNWGGIPGPAGPTGQTGAQGQPGQAGANGANSWVVFNNRRDGSYSAVVSVGGDAPVLYKIPSVGDLCIVVSKDFSDTITFAEKHDYLLSRQITQVASNIPEYSEDLNAWIVRVRVTPNFVNMITIWHKVYYTDLFSNTTVTETQTGIPTVVSIKIHMESYFDPKEHNIIQGVTVNNVISTIINAKNKIKNLTIEISEISTRFIELSKIYLLKMSDGFKFVKDILNFSNEGIPTKIVDLSVEETVSGLLLGPVSGNLYDSVVSSIMYGEPIQ